AGEERQQLAATAERAPQRDEEREGDERHRPEPERMLAAEPALADLRLHERRPDAHHADECGDSDGELARLAPRPRLQVALGLEDQPASTEQPVTRDEARAGEDGERREP